MKKWLSYILIPIVIVVGVSIPTTFADAQVAQAAQVASFLMNRAGADLSLNSIFLVIFTNLLTLLTWVTGISGLLLNYVLDYTIVNMSAHISGGTIGGQPVPPMVGINIAWKVIRDLMNIAFIFMLVYEGILLIVGQGSLNNIKKFITGLVLASILINFSLFFTKVLIDASNIVTIGFYNAAVGTTPPNGLLGLDWGLSSRVNQSLGITSLYGQTNSAPGGAGLGGIFIWGFGSGIVLVITSFIYFAITILFVVRYIVLIILLLLSPVAYMGMALPFMQPYARQWWDALRSQLLFAPIYMIMTWVILTLMGTNGFITTINRTSFAELFAGQTTQQTQAASMGLILNFAVTIGMLIASLIIAKSTSVKGASIIKDAVTKASSWAGSAVAGSTAWAGRKTIGFAGSSIADNAKLQEAAATKTGFSGAGARLALYGSRQARDATFDVRNASVPTSVVGDVIGGTVGRTGVGKAMGLNDVNIPNIAVGAPLSNLAGTGPGGTKGYRDEKAAREKRVGDREKADKLELATAQSRDAVNKGKDAAVGTPEYDAMEKALAKLSDKQTEALVESNKELLASQNFANMLSVKQLEALNKSDKFSDDEKDTLKDKRFSQIKDINDVAGLAALAVPPASRTPAQIADATKVESARGKVKGLTDSEIEMLDPAHLSDPEFVKQLRSGQFESIGKSNKFTSGQKKSIRDARMSPLLDALDTTRAGHAPNPTLIKNMITKGMSVKDVAGLMSTNATFTDHTGTTVTASILTHPEVLNQYTPNMLKRMGQEMNSGDIQILRDVIEDAGTTPGSSRPLTNLAAWLSTPDGQNFS